MTQVARKAAEGSKDQASDGRPVGVQSFRNHWKASYVGQLTTLNQTKWCEILWNDMKYDLMIFNIMIFNDI